METENKILFRKQSFFLPVMEWKNQDYMQLPLFFDNDDMCLVFVSNMIFLRQRNLPPKAVGNHDRIVFFNGEFHVISKKNWEKMQNENLGLP
jgi:hypothetical protein